MIQIQVIRGNTIRNLSILGAAFAAIFVLTAVIASVASAASYTASGYPATLTGESPLGNERLQTESLSVECVSHFQSTLSAPTSTLAVTTKYSSCTSFLGATVATNGCEYLLTSPALKVPDVHNVLVDVVCPTGQAISIVIGGGKEHCEMTIGPQTNLSSADIVNNTVAGDITMQATFVGINYTVTYDKFGCPFNGTGLKTGATLTQFHAVTLGSTNGVTIDVG